MAHSGNELSIKLESIVGAAALAASQENRELYSHDVFYRQDPVAGIVVAPSSTEELARVVATATAAGAAVVPRGGGMSYTAGYTPQEEESILVDMTQMNRVLEINEADMYVTVECGCTWDALNEALKEKGLRTPFWGPLSGLVSTIGGGLSQLNAFFGGSIWGTTCESLLSIKVVLADGTILNTGSASTQGGKPFYRFYGPDIAGLFMGDAGALGVKAEATFRLMRRPAQEGYASFAFTRLEDSANAMSELSRESIGGELFGFDPGLTEIAMARGNWSDNLKAVANVAKAQDSLLAGAREAAKTVIAGKSIADAPEFSVHVVAESRTQAGVDTELALARDIVQRHHGKEIDNSIPKVIRAAPFGPVDSMVGPNGERWVPTHGVVCHSDATAIWRDFVALFASRAEEIARHGVRTGILTCTMATNGFLIEPVMIWPDKLLPMHRHYVSPSYLGGLPDLDANPDARRFVTEMRARLVDVFSKYKAVHYQIGKAYPYRAMRDAAAWKILVDFKRTVDPQCRINPGCLGLQPADIVHR